MNSFVIAQSIIEHANKKLKKLGYTAELSELTTPASGGGNNTGTKSPEGPLAQSFASQRKPELLAGGSRYEPTNN